MVLPKEENRMINLSWRVWILIIALSFSFLAISPWNYFEQGVIIKSVEKNSTAFNEGLRQGMIIQKINDKEIKTVNDYSAIMSEIFSDNESEKLSIISDKGNFVIFTKEPLEINIEPIPKTKLKTGLDLSGGARALVRPENVSLTPKEMADLISTTSERLNVFGITDMNIKQVEDLGGNSYMLIEVAGSSPSEMQELVGKQGKFEARIGEEIVFIGGERDVASVCRDDATCARIESCSPNNEGYSCRFSFTVYLSEQAAQRHADITSHLGIDTNTSAGGGRYLDKKLDLFIDDSLVDSLFISEDLKGRAETQISVSGSGFGATEKDAFDDAKRNMNKLQTILITGSLPYKLEIVKLDSISPSLGKEFTKNIIILGLIVFVIISVVLFVKYRKIKITGAVILTMFSEAFITLGIAALIKWNLDAPSIAGIIAGMGTGVNDQIIIIDESVSNKEISMIERIKRALFIIIGAFSTIIVAMIPLFWAGAGMLKGFALTTIISISIGILITRPAFADILKRME